MKPETLFTFSNQQSSNEWERWQMQPALPSSIVAADVLHTNTHACLGTAQHCTLHACMCAWEQPSTKSTTCSFACCSHKPKRQPANPRNTADNKIYETHGFCTDLQTLHVSQTQCRCVLKEQCNNACLCAGTCCNDLTQMVIVNVATNALLICLKRTMHGANMLRQTFCQTQNISISSQTTTKLKSLSLSLSLPFKLQHCVLFSHNTNTSCRLIALCCEHCHNFHCCCL